MSSTESKFVLFPLPAAEDKRHKQGLEQPNPRDAPLCGSASVARPPSRSYQIDQGELALKAKLHERKRAELVACIVARKARKARADHLVDLRMKAITASAKQWPRPRCHPQHHENLTAATRKIGSAQREKRQYTRSNRRRRRHGSRF
ncbi:hypothetical protein K438DRAFT_1746708 [Mycena galopus ATCC 62051]|nr:hypothetical protein K438DRAFT_1746708 [Mycena galopus ATCC 62051]